MQRRSANASGDRRFTSVEARIDAAAHAVLDRLPASGPAGGLVELVVFGLKQGWACLFGGLMVGLLIATSRLWPADAPLARYDFLFLSAIAIQAAMLGFKLETWREARVIAIFHIVGTAMEVFKTGAGSWSYPEAAYFRLYGVPLFSGFMYASVGSYMARVTRVFDIRMANYPVIALTVALAVAIYVNFFTHHFIFDFRYVLFAGTAVLFWRTTMWFRVHLAWRRMPLLVAFGLVTLFIWLAENIGTLTRTWLYPNQYAAWAPLGPGKFGSWFLLMIVSAVLVTLVHPPRPPGEADRSGALHRRRFRR